MKKALLFFLFPLFQSPIFAQLIKDSLYHQGYFRSFVIHVPSNLNHFISAPLVITLHGNHTSAIEMMNYSGFNATADSSGFIVVYPNGYLNNWAIGQGTPADKEGIDDIDFFSTFIDYIIQRYNINSDKIYIAGYSDGGYMAQLLSIKLFNKIAAVASVAAPFLENKNRGYSNSCAKPIIFIQGTTDPFIKFNSEGPFDNASLHYSKKRNDCISETIAKISDAEKNDNCNVVKKTFTSCSDDTEVLQYIVKNGGHTWPGAFDIPALGNTNKDINAASEIWKFFNKHILKICIEDTPFNRQISNQNPSVSIYPNPVQRSLFVSYAEGGINKVEIFNHEGKSILVFNESKIEYPFNISFLSSGFYMLKISLTNGETIKSMMVKE